MNRELLLLGLLRQQEMHGYELHEFINSKLSSCTDMKKSTAYYLLNKMEETGLLSVEIIQEGNRPPRQVYQLTPAGEVEFQRLLRENLSHYNQTYLADDIGLAFLDTLEAQDAIDLLSQRRAELRDALETAINIKPRKNSLHLVFEHLAHHLKSELDWINTIIARLSKANSEQ